MKSLFSTLVFVLVCPLLCFGATQKDETEGVSRTYVMEGKDAVLHCSSGESLEKRVIHWKIKDKDVLLYEHGHHTEQYRRRASLFYDELKNGNASMILRDTRVEDTGNYTCSFSLASMGSGRSTIELVVKPVFRNRFGLEKGAVQTPLLGISDFTEGGVELRCVVRGSSSKPSVEWQTCEGISLNATGQTVPDTRGCYNTTVLVTVTETETNCFSCVVTQEDIYHRIHNKFTVSEKLFEKKSCYSSRVLCAVGLAGAALCLVACLIKLLCEKKNVPVKMMDHVKKSMDEIIHKGKPMEEMKRMSNNKTSDPNTGNESIDENMRNATVKTEEKEELMPINTSGETDGEVKLKIPQTESDDDETSV